MNKLPFAKKLEIANSLIAGVSLRETAKTCDISVNTVSKFLYDIGRACQIIHDESVRKLSSEIIDVNEVCSYSTKKRYKHDYCLPNADEYVFFAIDRQSKLVISWVPGTWNPDTAVSFVTDVAKRLAIDVLIVRGDRNSYLTPLDFTSSENNGFNAGQLSQIYEINCEAGVDRDAGSQDLRQPPIRLPSARQISGENKHKTKDKNRFYAFAVHFTVYNFVKHHDLLKVTPAMAAGVSERPLTPEDIVKFTEYIR
jgi:hypothetical protein